jgi:hypothetical protein
LSGSLFVAAGNHDPDGARVGDIPPPLELDTLYGVLSRFVGSAAVSQLARGGS